MMKNNFFVNCHAIFINEDEYSENFFIFKHDILLHYALTGAADFGITPFSSEYNSALCNLIGK